MKFYMNCSITLSGTRAQSPIHVYAVFVSVVNIEDSDSLFIARSFTTSAVGGIQHQRTVPVVIISKFTQVNCTCKAAIRALNVSPTLDH